MKTIAVLLLAVLLSSCVFDPPAPSPPSHYYTFAEVSQPYLDQYGPAEEENKYTSADYSTVDWWWWSKGFEVTFLNTTYDDVNGWTVNSTYEFDPIY
jgi:hypothetical protein